MPRSSSLLSSASNSTQAVKKVAKSVEKAVKKGAAAISRPFKKCHKVSSESVGRSFFSIVANFFITESYIYLTVSNNGNSTKETSAMETSTREPSVININPSDEEGNGSTDDKTPEEELSKFHFYYMILKMRMRTRMRQMRRAWGLMIGMNKRIHSMH